MGECHSREKSGAFEDQFLSLASKSEAKRFMSRVYEEARTGAKFNRDEFIALCFHGRINELKKKSKVPPFE